MAVVNFNQAPVDQSSKNRRRLIFSLVFIGILLAILIVSHYGFVEIDAGQVGGGKEITYKIIDQKSQKIKEVKTGDSIFKRLMPKASYEVVVSANDSSYFEVIKSRGWLGSTTVSANLQPEKSREFVGNNPKGCVIYVSRILYSYDCGSPAGSLTTHVPATSSQPTYVLNTDHNIKGYIVGSVSGDQPVLLTKSLSLDGSGVATYSLLVVGSKLHISYSRSLTNLTSNQPYNITAYKSGFIVYSQDFKQVMYFSSASAQPSSINPNRPADSEQKPFLLSTNGDSGLALYSNKTDYVEADNSKPLGKLEAYYSLFTSAGVRTGPLNDKLNDQINQAMPCGSAKLCVLSGQELRVYDVNDDKATLEYKVTGISRIEANNKKLLLVKSDGVFNLDVDSRSGYMEYSFGDYTYCGLQVVKNGYILCVTDGRGKNSALLINQTQKNTGSIDKKVSDLFNLVGVSDISSYGRFIYVSPDISQLTNPGTFNFNQVKVRDFNNQLNTEVSRLGIDPKIYQVISTSR